MYVAFLIPASSPVERSTSSVCISCFSAQRRYIRSSVSAQSCASVPPAPALNLRIAARLSYSPENSKSLRRSWYSASRAANCSVNSTSIESSPRSISSIISETCEHKICHGSICERKLAACRVSICARSTFAQTFESASCSSSTASSSARASICKAWQALATRARRSSACFRNGCIEPRQQSRLDFDWCHLICGELISW